MTSEQILVLANVLSFIGNAFFTSALLFRSKKKINALQTGNHLLSSGATFLIHEYSGMFQDIVLFIRNLIVLFIDEEKKILRVGISVLSILVGIVGGILVNVTMMKGVWYGYLPIIGYAIYSLTTTLMYIKESWSENQKGIILRCSMIVNAVLWSIYGIYISLIPLAIFSCITVAVALYGILHIGIEIHKEKKASSNDSI